MSMRSPVLLLVLAFATAAASGGGLQSQEPTRKEKYLLDVTLASGLNVHHVVYHREPLGGRSLLQIKKQSGLILSSHDGGTVPSLSEAEFDELMSRLLEITHRDHHDQLDSIQIELALIDPLWGGAVEHLRGAAIAPDYRIDPKSNSVLSAMQSYLGESTLVRRVCEQVATIEKKCKRHAVSMNPVIFRLPYLWKKWGDVRHQGDAGIEKESIWFAIDFEDQ